MTEVATREPFSAYRDQIDKAKMLAEADIIPDSYKKKPANILVAMEMADTLHLTLFQAMQGVQTIKGRLSMAAELMRALVLRDGHTLHIDAMTRERCAISAGRAGDDELQVFEYTMVDAQGAGLAAQDNYKRNPKAMLLARCTSQTCRAIFPDVIAGIGYTPDELAESDTEAPKVVTAARLMPPKAAPGAAVPAPVDLPPGVWMDADGVVHEADDAEVMDPPAE